MSETIMDALPMREQAERPHVSRHHGVHHGCGHDGQGDAHAASLHHLSYDFNDDVLAFGVRWFVAMARLALHDSSDTPRHP